MLDFLKRLFGSEPQQVLDPRPVLADAVAELGTPALAGRALELYDDPAAFVAYAQECGAFLCWDDEGRQPEAAELAFDVFRTLMIEEGRIGMIDWADGPLAIAEVFEAMLANAGAPGLCEREQRELEALAEGG